MLNLKKDKINSENNEVSADVQKLIHEIWASVFGTANKIISAHASYGYQEISNKLNPSLKEIVLSLKTIESSLDILDSGNVLDYDEKRLVINSKQQINNVLSVALAVESGEIDDYNRAIDILKKQAPF